MKEANARANIMRLIGEKNYLGAQLFLKQAELDQQERNELLGLLAAAIVDELSATRREDRERVTYLRSVLSWVLREVPGLGSTYREQLRDREGRQDLLADLSRGLRNVGDVARGRKSFTEGVQDAADDVRRNFEDAGERVRSGEAGERTNEFFSNAERGIKEGLDQLGSLFRSMTEQMERRPDREGQDSDRDAAARAEADRDVEDAEFEPEDEPEDIDVERE
ncbi:MAG: hypothetical protein ACLFP4_04550 [Spirochaetales bacterium]